MSEKYFDQWEFTNIHYLADTNPLESKLRFEEYLEKYPKDYSAYPYYASVLITLGEFKNAEKLLNYVKNKYINDDNFCKNKDKIEILEYNIIFTTLRLLSYQEKYDKLYNLYFNNYEKLNDLTSARFDLYIKKKASKLDSDDINVKTYIHNQIISYSESEFLEHIKKHQADYNQNLDNPNKNIFVPDFPIDNVIKEVKKYIMCDRRLYNGFIENVYIFKYDNCGRENNKLVDYFKVVCFHNTKDFITMLPSSGCENLPYIDLNYLILKKEDYKVKKISQIDKFNKKYKMN